MKPASLFLAAIVYLAPALQARPKVATLNIQKALFSTADGKLAVAEMERNFGPILSRVDRERSELESLRNRLRDGAATLTAEETAMLKGRIGDLTKTYGRERADAEQRLEAEQTRVLKDLASKLMVVVERYAKQRHFEVVLDDSDMKTPILWRADRTDITDEVIKRYEMTKEAKKH
jgi:Skp family chaperone for outer membrane proteins